jgi:2-polyprenyl-3-methyl-5-hydroxy-6-metoxy-1,4-benzoquinol methylase
MLKYISVATALKLFSFNSSTRKAYRALGNRLGARNRISGKIPQYYLDRIERKLDFCRRHDILRDGDWVLELGTGWLHWEAVTLRLFFNINALLYDVWDNRQFTALQSYLQQADAAFARGFCSKFGDVDRARDLIRKIAAVETFDQLYDLLGFKYVIDATGTLQGIHQDKFRLVTSAGVFEHVHRDGLPAFVSGWARMIQPGGFAFHSIHISDHLYLYDRTASPKQYLAWSERTWKLLFENEVQYINRVQPSEWFALFAQAGLLVKESGQSTAEIGNLSIAERYKGMARSDWECTDLRVLLQKPD